ncbi:MAG: transporter [Calothrix sp. MO_167.B12]|nr:transporter [Calothrix sp. MO_167.B12]
MKTQPLKYKSKFLASFFLGITATISLFPQIVQAADHLNLEEGLPTEVEDAYPIPYQGIELQGAVKYDRINGKDSLIIEPRIEYGFAPNWQGRIAVPFQFGSAESDGIGDVGVEVFYNFNTETLKTPAFALSVGVDTPTGEDSVGVDPTVKLIMTKTLGTGANLDRLHVNVGYTFNDAKKDDERRNVIKAVAGYSRRLDPQTILVTDFVYEQEKEEKKDAYILELGIRRQATPLTVWSIGAGLGIGRDSPDFRVTAGIQHSL